MSSKPIEIHFDKRLNNLNLVQEADAGQRREFLIITILVILMVLGALAYGWQHYQHRDLGYRVEAASKTQKQLLKDREKLRSEHQFLRSSERIDRLSRERGMVVPAPGQVRVVAPSGPEEVEPSPELAASQ
ncbi:MAG TPA: hypothetical protein VFY29_18375 [Terriglobia bacterium]|nr:hypothetical protein [Terriglobia bacterium]